ncbi:MAG: hypothetical protein RI900_712 [Actinomycetota bacterium]
MKRVPLLLFAVVQLAALSVVQPVGVGPATAGGGITEPTVPVLVPGARVVDVRNGAGGLSRFTTIPSTSLFQTYGGRSSTCTFTSPFGGTTSDGQRYAPGQLVRSRRWIFIEGLPEAIGEPNVADPSQHRGALASAVRWFTVFCDTVNHFVAVISVTSRDPMLDPRSQLTQLYNGLLLERPAVARDPVVERWGGAVTRFPVWLAVQPSAWRVQRSNAAVWRGWTMYLIATPVSLDFSVRFSPDPTRPSSAFSGAVACVSPTRPGVADARSFPRRPVLPGQTVPGVNGPCTWTPAGPGSVTVQARITYRVTFWANGYTESLPDYVWTSNAVVWPTGELAAVNTNG